jgi:hypothetical protein
MTMKFYFQSAALGQTGNRRLRRRNASEDGRSRNVTKTPGRRRIKDRHLLNGSGHSDRFVMTPHYDADGFPLKGGEKLYFPPHRAI